MSAPAPHDPGTFRLLWAVIRYRPWRYVAGVALWMTWWAMPAGVGLALKAVVDGIAGEPTPGGLGVPALVGLLVGVEVVRIAVFWPAVLVFTHWWIVIMAWLRGNLLHAQLSGARGEAGPAVSDGSSAIPVFRDDIHDIVLYADTWLDVLGAVGFAVVALTVMASIDPILTGVVIAPLALVIAVNRILARRIRATRRADREATAAVTGFLGSAFSAVLALKVAGAEDRAVDELRRRNATRSRTAVRDRVLEDSLTAFSASTVEVSVGLVLLVVASAMRDGTFGVGDLALFISYLGALSGVPRWVGIALTRHRHAQVAFARAGALLPASDPARLVVPRPVRLVPSPAVPVRPRPTRPPAPTVSLCGLTAGVLTGVDLVLPAGSFTVVCGSVGSGKTTLLRALLGALPLTAGEVRWDGEVIEDLAAHMVPPRVAAVAQVPRLFTGTLEANLTLGVDTAPDALDDVLRRSAFDTDVRGMGQGLTTTVGARGVRLSGGQLQRAAAARALAADPALLVLDDLSSALDATTERRVWSGLLDDVPRTCLVVSHRAAALERADQVVLLDAGRVRAVGTLADLRAQGLDPLVAAPTA
jgi:ATP-binding cassette subfamily B protein